MILRERRVVSTKGVLSSGFNHRKKYKRIYQPPRNKTHANTSSLSSPLKLEIIEKDKSTRIDLNKHFIELEI